MRILLVSDVDFPRFNGISTSIQAFAHQFLALSHEVTLIATAYGTEAAQRFPIHRTPSRPVPFDADGRQDGGFGCQEHVAWMTSFFPKTPCVLN